MPQTLRYLFILCLFGYAPSLQAADFTFVNKTTKVSIVYARNAPALDSITANLLADDIRNITSYRPQVLTDISKATGNVIVIGSAGSQLIQRFAGTKALTSGLKGKWECYALKVLANPAKNIKQALIIAGSDTRGTAYGVFSLSEKIGISPWYWWADVYPAKKAELVIELEEYISTTPSVKYRGIFLNDEDWGLQPWAAKTFEPETDDIGPKTYAKIFELLLRLKANLIWPAMHPSTKAFYHYPGNSKIAAAYGILIGSSHAEPMLRNNVGEWDENTMGDFNYLTNKDNVYNYWESRVKESSRNDAIYTMGMRGVHDSGIEGVKTPQEAVPLLQRIIADQRNLLKKYLNKDVSDIPRVFTAYKEVLDIYDAGLKIPDDITLVWPDDNYGYIQRLNNQQEKLRPGGSGIYYHASYWGRPHDYLWLSSTHPALIREEMMKAYENGSNRLWVLNVGDIKPLEYNIQLFMDMAYNAGPFRASEYIKQHLTNWNSSIFGTAKAAPISKVMWDYYQLAFERRPEFMGWSQTEPTTKTTYTKYNHFYYGDEAQKRIDKYEALEKAVKRLRTATVSNLKDAFYELIYYPVVGASLMNKKFLYRDKAYLYSLQGRSSAADYATLSKQAYSNIASETDFYNNQLAGGKWKNMMSFKPRDLPVYQEPVLPDTKISSAELWSISPEGFIKKDSSAMALPVFSSAGGQKYFIDVFLQGDKPVSWAAVATVPWIKLSEAGGTLTPQFAKKETRLWVNVDWSKVPAGKYFTGEVVFKTLAKTIAVAVAANRDDIPVGYKGFVEQNGYIAMNATSYTRKLAKPSGEWKLIDGLGQTGRSLIAVLNTDKAVVDPAKITIGAPVLEYDFYSFTSAVPQVNIYTLPTQPLNKNYGMRYAVSIDNGPLKIVDFKTAGRSEEWKLNVLRNNAIRSVKTDALSQGKHTVKIYLIDPGVVLDRITIDLGGLEKAYGVLPETKH